MAGFGLTITLIDLFLRTSRAHDILLPFWHVPLVVMLFGFVAVLATGRVFEFMLHPLGRWLSGFTVLALLSTGVSVWPGGAYQFLMEVWIPALPALVMMCAFIRTFEHVRKVVVCTALGYGMIPLFVMLLGREVGVERVGLVWYTFGDANDMAMAILFWLPFAVWTLANKKTSLWIKIYIAGAVLACVPVFFRTGSRSGLLTLGVISLYLLYRQPTAIRLRLVLVAAIAIPIGLAATPRAVIDRYRTIFDGFAGVSDPIADPAEKKKDVNESAVNAAQASTGARLELLKRSIAVTLANPVLGVGPGMFMVAENEMAVAGGRRRGYWKASHNMYTQISAEMGIPALILLLFLLYRVWRILTMAEKADPAKLSFARDLRKLAFGLKVSLLVFAAGGVTLSLGYSSFLLFLCSMAIITHRLMAMTQRQGALAGQGAPTQSGAPRVQAPSPAMARAPLPY